ncbi:TPA: tail fiber domain-containing protein [Serratia marcescens]|nr:tail fiber domain-containing protein [Serratia marcescens]
MATYDTGTVTFSGTTVNGSGVNWQTANNPVRPGNTLLVMPANEAFTVVRINSATQLVVNRAPTKAISNSAYCLLLTDALSNDALAQRVSEMTRYYEQQVNAWGQLITASEDVSIIGPDGSAVKVPSLKKLYDGLGAKADKSELDKKADKAEVEKKANKTDLGNSATRNVGATTGTVAAGDDGRLNTVGGKSGGQLTGGLGVLNGVNNVNLTSQGTYLLWNEQTRTGVSSIVNNPGDGPGGVWIRLVNKANSLERARFTFSPDGTMIAPSGVYSLNGRIRSFTGLGGEYVEIIVDGVAKGIKFFDSDERLKEKIIDIEKGSALSKLRMIRPVSYKFKDTHYKENGETKTMEGKRYSYGVIAQEIIKIIPDAVITLSNGNMSLDPLSVIGFLLATNKDMLERIDRQDEIILSLAKTQKD